MHLTISRSTEMRLSSHVAEEIQFLSKCQETRIPCLSSISCWGSGKVICHFSGLNGSIYEDYLVSNVFASLQVWLSSPKILRSSWLNTGAALPQSNLHVWNIKNIKIKNYFPGSSNSILKNKWGHYTPFASWLELNSSQKNHLLSCPCLFIHQSQC